MSEIRLHPILKIRAPFGLPSHSPFGLWLTANDNYWRAKLGGGISNLERYDLEQTPKAREKDELGTGKKPGFDKAISLSYTLPPDDKYNNLRAWETVPTDAEKLQLDAARAFYEAKRDELVQQELDHPPLSASDAALLQGYRDMVQQTIAAQSVTTTWPSAGHRIGFLMEIPDVFSPGAGLCLYDFLGVPNVDKVRRSTFNLDADRPWHLDLWFDAPNVDQAKSRKAIYWGPFKLEFVDGAAVYLSMYAAKWFGAGGALDIAAILDREADLKFYTDQGELTVEDMAYITAQNAAANVARKAIRDQKLKTDDPARKPFDDAIEKAKQNVRERQQLKKAMPGAAAASAAEIVADLYSFHNQRINLGEDSENFYNHHISLTCLPQEAGFLTFTLTNGKPVTVDLPEILKTQALQILWHDSPMVLKSNGGSMRWRFIYPAVAGQGVYRIPSVPVPFEITNDTTLVQVANLDAQPARGIMATLALPEAADSKPNARRYDFVLNLRSDWGLKNNPDLPDNPANVGNFKNAYLPWLYSAYAFIPPGDRPANTTVLWRTEGFGTTKTLTPGFANPNRDNPIANVTMSHEDSLQSKRGATMEIHILDPNGTADFKGYQGHLCDFKVGKYNPDTNAVTAAKNWMLNGVIRSAAKRNAKNFADDDPGNPKQLYGVDTYHAIDVVDLITYLDDFTIPCEIILDGLNLGEMLRLIYDCLGCTEADMAGIPTTGPLAGERAKPTPPGRKPLWSPAVGTRVGNVRQEAFDRYGVSSDNRELRLTSPDGVLTLDAPSATIKAAYSGAAAVTGPYIVKAGGQEVVDPSNFYNVHEVRGRIDPLTGEPVTALWIIQESLNDPTHPLYLGYEKRLVIERPDLETKGECERAAEISAIRRGKAFKFQEYECWWPDQPHFPGDTVTVDGGTREIVRMASMEIAAPTTCHLSTRAVVPLP